MKIDRVPGIVRPPGLSYMTTPPGRPGYNYAQAHAIAEVRTNNNTTNAPMLAVNERLGDRRLPGRIRFGRAP